ALYSGAGRAVPGRTHDPGGHAGLAPHRADSRGLFSRTRGDYGPTRPDPWRGAAHRGSALYAGAQRREGAVMPPPAVWSTLTTELWGLSAPESQRLWRALAGSRALQPMSFRQQCLLVESGPGWDIRHFCRTTCSVRTMVQVLEALVAEQRLTRVEA